MIGYGIILSATKITWVTGQMTWVIQPGSLSGRVFVTLVTPIYSETGSQLVLCQADGVEANISYGPDPPHYPMRTALRGFEALCNNYYMMFCEPSGLFGAKLAVPLCSTALWHPNGGTRMSHVSQGDSE